MQTEGKSLGRWRAHGVTLGFYLYALAGAPWLAGRLQAGLAGPDPLWAPGALLLAVLPLEPVGLRWKLQFLRRRNREDGFEPQGRMLGLFSATGIGHVIATMLAGMLVLDCWGLAGAERDQLPAAAAVVLVGLVLKEFIGLFAAGGQSLAKEAPGHWKETAADALLGLYGCVVYTAWWGAIVNVEALGEISFGTRLALLPFIAGLFLFLYLPMRLPFLLEETLRKPAAGRKGRIALELAVGAALGLYPAFF